MATALVQFVQTHPNHAGTIAFLSTSDEEKSGVGGTQAVLDLLVSEGTKIDAALVGEPTSELVFGDIVKVGRRGSLNATLTVEGRQGHTAYPHLAVNAVHRLAPFLSELVSVVWDEGDDVFLPTTCQVSNLRAGTGAPNVVPGSATLDFNFRFGPASPEAQIITRVEELLAKHNVPSTLKWLASAQPFRTATPWLVTQVSEAVREVTGQIPKEGTGGGTSDARCFAGHGIPVVEFGPNNATIHAVDEYILVQELEDCVKVFTKVLTKMTLPK
jgi:succinyl-diaminopimelate desuccinylase